jgi:hypothetical protein
MAPAQQAAIRCNDPLFRAFLEWQFKAPMKGTETAAAFVRTYCGVSSRGEILPGTSAAREWKNLDQCFDDWKIAERAGVI